MCIRDRCTKFVKKVLCVWWVTNESKSTFVFIEQVHCVRRNLSCQRKLRRTGQQWIINRVYWIKHMKRYLKHMTFFYFFVIAKGIFLCTKRFQTIMILDESWLSVCVESWEFEDRCWWTCAISFHRGIQFIIFCSHKEKQQLIKKCLQQYCLLLERILFEQLGEKAWWECYDVGAFILTTGFFFVFNN